LDDPNEHHLIIGDTTVAHNPPRILIEMVERDPLAFLKNVEHSSSPPLSAKTHL
jgi:hypothetical protein